MKRKRFQYFALIFLAIDVFLIPITANAYSILDETAFFARYENPTTVFNLSDKGWINDCWLVRVYQGGMFTEDVSFGYERGESSPYPIVPNGNLSYYQVLTLNSPAGSEYDAEPVAIYTDIGFFGIVPSNANEKFYKLYGSEAIFNIATVSSIPVPEPGTFWLFFTGAFGFAIYHQKKCILFQKRPVSNFPRKNKNGFHYFDCHTKR